MDCNQYQHLEEPPEEFSLRLDVKNEFRMREIPITLVWNGLTWEAKI